MLIFLLLILPLMVLVLCAAYWLLRIRRSTVGGCHQLLWLYGAESACLVAIACAFYRICASDSLGVSLLKYPETMGGLFVFPPLYLLFRYAMEGRVLNRRLLLGHLGLFALFALVVLAVRAADGWGIAFSPVVLKILNSSCNALLFANVMTYGSLFVFRWQRYRKEMDRVCSSRSQSDYARVRNISWVAVGAGIVIYLLLCLGLRTLVGNVAMLVSLYLVLVWMVIFLGAQVAHVRGLGLPNAVDWKVHSLSDEQLEALESRFHIIDEIKQTQDATVDISRTLDAWISDPRKPYLRRGISLNDVADQTGIPTKLLSAYLNKTLNRNFNEWINLQRLKEVKLQLLSTDRTLDEIAAGCGFTDRSALSRIFKQAEGVSPSDYRNAH